MPDQAILGVGIDSSGMKTGGDQASRVLDDLSRKFAELEARSNALKGKLQDSGQAIKGASGHWQEFGNSARNALGALSGLGGPIGTVAGKVENLTSQLGGLTSAFGLAAGAAVGLVAGVVAAGAGIATLALQGVKLSDEISDLGQSLGFSRSQMERFNAASRIAGESVSILERSFSQFELAVQAGIEDPTSRAGRALLSLGVNLKKAASDPQSEYLKLVTSLDGVTASINSQNAAQVVFSRGTAALIRVSAELRDQLKLTDDQLIHMGLIASPAASEAAAKVDRSFNELAQRFDTFKREALVPLANAFLDLADVIAKAMSDGEGSAKRFASAFEKEIRNSISDMDQLKEAFLRGFPNTLDKRLFRATRDAITGAEQPPPVGPRLPATPEANLRLLNPPRQFDLNLPDKPRAPRATPTATPAATESDLQKALSKQRAFFDSWRNIAAAFYDTQIISFEQYTTEVTKREREMRQQQLNDALFLQGQLEGQLARIPQGDTASIARVTAELEKMRERVGELGLAIAIKTLPEIDKLTERLKDFGKLNLPLGPTPRLSGIPGVIDLGQAPHPDDIGRPPGVSTRDRTVTSRIADRERINQEFSFVFEDFIFQIASARKGLGQAFGDFALGMVDVFASEFARAFQQSLQKAFISPLANWLEGALTEIFSGISGKGIGKFFGGLFKSVFSGFFAEGGTIPANHFGVVGERGPELAFAGSQPMTITPIGSGGGGNSVSVTFHVNAPGGSLDRRSMDQMSEQVLRAVERGTRNRGV